MSHRTRRSSGGGSRSRSRSRSRAAQRSQSRRSSQRRQRGRSRAAQRSQSKRDSQRRQRANVREAARSRGQANKILPKSVRDRVAAAKSMQSAGIGSLSGMTGLTGKSERLNLEYKNPNTSDDRKKEIVRELKDVRSDLNKQNKELAFKNLLDKTKTNKGLVARTSDGSIITDSSGNPIMSTAGREVFDQTRGGFGDRSGYLLETNPELYKRMYPISYGLQKGLPKLMEFAPVIGPIGRIAKATLGKAQDVGSGIMGSKPVQSITSAPGGFFGDFKNMISGLGSFLPGGGGGGRGVYQPTRSVSGRVQEGGDVDRGGVMDAAQSVVDNIYGSRIGVTGPVTGDFRDSDGDGIDDRYQTGPGTPYQGPAMDPFQFKKPNPFDSSFQIAQPVVTQPFDNQFNYSVSPLSNQYTQQGIADPNLAQYYQNLNLFPRVV